MKTYLEPKEIEKMEQSAEYSTRVRIVYPNFMRYAKKVERAKSSALSFYM